jgi:hypothetical protein
LLTRSSPLVRKQVGIGILVRVGMLRDDLLVDLGGIEPARLGFGGDGTDAVDDLLPPAVAENKDEREAVVPGQRGLRLAQLLMRKFRQPVSLADDFEIHVVISDYGFTRRTR